MSAVEIDNTQRDKQETPKQGASEEPLSLDANLAKEMNMMENLARNDGGFVAPGDPGSSSDSYMTSSDSYMTSS